MNRATCTLALVACAVGVSSARADFITPAGLKPGDQFRVVFVTNTLTEPTSSSISYYDSMVSNEAAAAGLATYNGSPVTWEALVSTSSVSAISRLPADSVPIYLPDGTEVASSGTQLWSGEDLLSYINLTAQNVLPSGPDRVWTGTDQYGQPYDPLGFQSDVRAGIIGEINNNWVAGPADPNFYSYHLYGFSSVLTVPEVTPVPEPRTLTLTLVGLGLFMALRLLRRWTMRTLGEAPAD